VGQHRKLGDHFVTHANWMHASCSTVAMWQDLFSWLIWFVMFSNFFVIRIAGY
jgi:hypothetical protein